MISFIVPVYNGEQYLRECLDSILGQSFGDLELVAVNDGSSDGSWRILEEYAARDSRVVILSQENQGVSVARNLGLANARGTYVWFFDCDDILLEGAAEAMHRAVSQAGADLAVGNYQMYRSLDGKVIPSPRQLRDHSYSGRGKLFCTHLNAFPMNKLWRRSVIQAHSLRFGNLCVGEDVDFYLRFLAAAQRIVTLQLPIFSYRLHDGSCSRTWSEKTLDVIKAFDGVEAFYQAQGGMECHIRELNRDRLYSYCSWIRDLPRCQDSLLRKKLLDAFLDAGERIGDSGRNGQAEMGLRRWLARIRSFQGFYGSSFCTALYGLLRQAKHTAEWLYRLLGRLCCPFSGEPEDRVQGLMRSLMTGQVWRHRRKASVSRTATPGFAPETGPSMPVWMEDGPLVSVVIPVYNVEPYLDRCLESLTGQSYPHLQIILVDDGSTDHSGQLCEKWAGLDSRIQVVHKANEGLGMARNTGLEYVQGAYVAFVDSDDYIDPRMVELLLDTLQKGQGQICFGGCVNVAADGTRSYGVPPEKLVYDGPGEIMEFMADALGVPPQVSGNCFAGLSAWGNLYDVSLFADGGHRFLREQDVLSEDIFFNLDVCRSVDRVLVAPWCLYHYCENQSSLTQRYRDGRFGSYKTMKGLLEKELEKELTANPALGRRIDRGYMDGLIVCIRQELRFCDQFGTQVCMNRIREMVEDPMTRQVLSLYPLSKMQFRQRVLFYLVRWRWVSAVCLLFWLRYGDRG